MASFLEDFLKQIAAKAPPAPQAPKQPVIDPNDPLKRFLQDTVKRAEQNQQAIMSKSPFLENVKKDTSALVRKGTEAVERFVGERAKDVKDALGGDLGATPSDYKQGAIKTAKGLGTAAKVVGQSIVGGTVSFGKSLMQGAFGKKWLEDYEGITNQGSDQSRTINRILTGEEDVRTAQEYVPLFEQYATEKGGTPNEIKTFGALGFFGLMAANSPFFGGQGRGAFKLGSEALEEIAKTTERDTIAATLVREGVDEEVANKVAPAFVNADTPRQVSAVVEDIKNGVKTVNEIANSSEAIGVTLRERGFGRNVADTFEDANYQPETYVVRNTEQLAAKARNEVENNLVRAEARIFSKEISDEISAIGAEYLKRQARMIDEATDAAAREEAQDKFTRAATELARKHTEAGRFNQAATILRSVSPEGKVAFAAREIEKYNAGNPSKPLPELTPEKANEIRETYKRIEEMPEGSEKEIAFAKAEEQLAREYSRTPFWKKLTTLWRAGLLTGLRTSGINIASTAFNTGLEQLSKIPAAAVDRVASMFTGNRTVSVDTMVNRLAYHLARGTKDKEGVVEGFKKGISYIKTGVDERRIRSAQNMAKVDFGNSIVGRAAEAYTETVFRVLGAEELPFWYGVRAASIYEQAVVAAKNIGLRGKEKNDFIEKFLKNPPDNAIENATADAAVATFTNSTWLGSIGTTIQNIPVIGDVLLPFTRTPAAVAMSVVNYSPVGVTNEIIKQIAKGKFDQRAFSKATGRSVTGTGLMAIGYELYKNDLVSLNRPDTERERNQNQTEGKKPNQIRVGDRWINAAALGPAGLAMILGGYIARGVEETGSVTDATMQTGIGMGTLLSEQSYMQGLSNFMEAVSNPENMAGTYVANLLGSTVPTMVADIAAGTDPNERQRTEIGDYFQNRIPVWRESLEPLVDIYGNKVGLTDEEAKDMRERGEDLLGSMLDFTRSQKAKSDPVIDELRRLMDAGYAATPTKLGDKKGYEALSDQENTRLWLGTGQLIKKKLDRLVEMPKYQQMDDEQKKKTIDKIVEEAKDHARAQFVEYLTAGITGEDLKHDLAAYKDSGLLTKGVFSLWNDEYRQ